MRSNNQTQLGGQLGGVRGLRLVRPRQPCSHVAVSEFREHLAEAADEKLQILFELVESYFDIIRYWFPSIFVSFPANLMTPSQPRFKQTFSSLKIVHLSLEIL